MDERTWTAHFCPTCGVLTTQPDRCQWCTRTPKVNPAEPRQIQYEYTRAIEALRLAENRLEELGKSEMAREVRAMRAQLMLGR